MKRKAVIGFLFVSFLCLFYTRGHAANLTLTQGGRVSIELISSEASFRNTLSVASPSVGVAIRGCALEAAGGLGGTHILSEKTSQRGCRVELDSDTATGGIQGFPAGTVIEFRFCAQTDADVDCEFVWSSNPASNSDGFDHLRTTPINPTEFAGRIFRLNWEDLEGGGDLDFDDLIAVVRVENDTDGDGLWDDWERFGVDTTGDGVVDLDLPALGSNPQRKDIFVEIDFMNCALAGGDCAAGDTHNHQPKAAAVTAVINAFANAATITNPDGSTGITLHLDVSNGFAHQNNLIIPNACFSGTAGTGFDAIKADPANFGPANPRRFTHHYGLFTHRQVAGQTWSGCAELPGNDFQISFGGWNVTGAADRDGDGLPDANVGTVAQQAGTLMHELGHNLNLGHGGGDWANFKPNYLSVMNYLFQTGGIPPTDPDGTGGPLTGRVDYSPALLATLAENNLNEPAGIGDGADNTFYNCPGGAQQVGAGTGPIDWNCDGDGGGDTGVSSDLNGDVGLSCIREGMNLTLETAPAGDDTVTGVRIFEGLNRQCDTLATGDDVQWRPTGPLTGYDDWRNIKYDFQNARDFDDGIHTPSVALEELTYELFLERVAPDLTISMMATHDPVVTGSEVTYTITVANIHPTAADGVTVTDLLPPSTSFVSCSATGGGVCGGTGNNRNVTVPSIPGGGSVSITLVASVACSLADGAAIANSASVSSTSEESDTANNSASVTVVASNPPPVFLSASANPALLWPPNHWMEPVTVDYVVTDNCGPLTHVLAVVSDEPVDDIADGHTSPDWEVIDATHLNIRSERAGVGDGRVYTVTITSTDSGGGSSTRDVSVDVPKNMP